MYPFPNRLLQYITPTHFSTPIKVESIFRAMGLLGRRNIQPWLRVTVMADLNKTDRDPDGTGCVWIKFLIAQKRGEWDTSNAILESQHIWICPWPQISTPTSEILRGEG